MPAERRELARKRWEEAGPRYPDPRNAGGRDRIQVGRRSNMDRGVLADRIVVYSDTVVAFSVVNGFAFLIALGEPDIRCSIAKISSVVGGLNLVFLIFCSLALVWLRRIELRLREAEDKDELVAQFWRIVVPLRIGLVWIFSVMVLGGIYAATFDTACGAPH
jgi:hypothetical protein